MQHRRGPILGLAAVLVFGLQSAAHTSSQIGAGVVITVKENGYTYTITYNWYMSGTGPGTDKCPYTGTPQETRIVNETHCLLNGSFIARDKFLEAIRVGLRHSMFSNRHHFEYPCIWTRDLDAVVGTVKAVSAAEVTVRVNLISREQVKNYPDCAPSMDKTIPLDGKWDFVLDGKKLARADAIPPEAWVSVYPTARPQTIEVRSRAGAVSLPFAGGEFDKADQAPYAHTAFGVITKVGPDGSYVLRGERDGKMQDIAFSNRIKDGVTLNGFFVPARRAIRVGRWAAACCYRKRDFPNQLMVTDPGPGAVEGTVKSVDGTSLTVSVDERLGGGEKRVVIEAGAVVLRDGTPSSAGAALQAGDSVTVLPARPPSIIAETLPEAGH